jgi:hypothetical protein
MLTRMPAIAGLVLVSLTLAAQPGTSPAASVKISKDTLIQCSLVQPLDPVIAKPGDDVPLRLTRPLAVGGIVVLPVNTVIHGKVTKVTPAGRRCANGEVKWKLQEILLPDGGRLKTQVWAAFRYPNARVPADIAHQHSSGEIAGYVIQDAVLLPLMPVGLAIGAGEAMITKPFRRGACRPGEGSFLPANATVALRVRANREFRY